MKRGPILLVSSVLVLLVVGGIAAVNIATRIRQPIRFNHLIHTEEVGLDCVDCHRYAESLARATIPNIEVCADCHEEVQSDSPEEEIVVAHVERAEPIPWMKVYWVPDHVFFSHRRHTLLGELECETCHGAVGERFEPVEKPTVDHSMKWCMDCHAARSITNDCIACHR